MDPATAMIGSALISGFTGAAGQHSANKTNVSLARENRAWQEKMSSSAYQRAMKDMRTAGLNPILAYQRGGASTPAGSLAQVGNVGLAGSQAAMNYSSAKQAQALAGKTQFETNFVLPKQIEQMDANIGVLNADKMLKWALKSESSQRFKLLEEQIDLTIEQTSMTTAQAAQYRTQAYLNYVAERIQRMDAAGWRKISDVLGTEVGPGSTKAVIDAMTLATNTFKSVLDVVFPKAKAKQWGQALIKKWKKPPIPGKP